jgi:hypothetical protein
LIPYLYLFILLFLNLLVFKIDEIWVEHRVEKASEGAKDVPVTSAYAEQFRSLLETGNHSDLTFIVGEEKFEIYAHRAVLSARSQYFHAMLREDNRMKESSEGIVRTAHEPKEFRRMLEFLYTNNVLELATAPAEDVVSLMLLANEYMLDDLFKLCAKFAAQHISFENIGRLFLLSAGHSGSVLREACSEFVRENKAALVADGNFRQDVEQNPELGLLLFECSLPKSFQHGGGGSGGEGSSGYSPGWAGGYASQDSNKRRRIADQNSENELDLVPPQLASSMGLNAAGASTSSTSFAAAAAAFAATSAAAASNTGSNAGSTPGLLYGLAAVPGNASNASSSSSSAAAAAVLPPHAPSNAAPAGGVAAAAPAAAPALTIAPTSSSGSLMALDDPENTLMPTPTTGAMSVQPPPASSPMVGTQGNQSQTHTV